MAVPGGKLPHVAKPQVCHLMSFKQGLSLLATDASLARPSRDLYEFDTKLFQSCRAHLKMPSQVDSTVGDRLNFACHTAPARAGEMQ